MCAIYAEHLLFHMLGHMGKEERIELRFPGMRLEFLRVNATNPAIWQQRPERL
jgi:hypothetical protein